ncbi:hypothetical protein J2Y68_003223 [Paenarthrobacter nitroguajacolicus]|nr:hypothetical protein [Paenarthrobacter nitroguajacolicus]
MVFPQRSVRELTHIGSGLEMEELGMASLTVSAFLKDSLSAQATYGCLSALEWGE